MIAGKPLKTPPQHLKVDPDFAGQRIDNFLISRLKSLPKSRLYRLLRKGEIRVNKKRIKADYRLQANDDIRIPPLFLSEPNTPAIPSTKLATTLNNRIIYEDNSLLIINKPAGMAVHGGSGINLGVIEALRHLRPQAHFLELVHRLDRDTSGCLLIAKKNSALRQLHELLRTGNVKKTYVTLVAGHWPKRLTQVEAPLSKNTLRSGERVVRVHETGKSSLTHFRVLKHFAHATLVEASPFTGRTHQIRVHAAHAGHPIAGDPKYGDKTFNQLMRRNGCNRLFLHAISLRFQLADEEPVFVETPLDPELLQILDSPDL